MQCVCVALHPECCGEGVYEIVDVGKPGQIGYELDKGLQGGQEDVTGCRSVRWHTVVACA